MEKSVIDYKKQILELLEVREHIHLVDVLGKSDAQCELEDLYGIYLNIRIPGEHEVNTAIAELISEGKISFYLNADEDDEIARPSLDMMWLGYRQR